MRKTSVYLSDELADRLARLAREEGRSQAEVLRAAVAAYRPRLASDRTFMLDGCVAGPGDSVADIGEDELLRGFGS
jgi:predicted transcriptional regulator